MDCSLSVGGREERREVELFSKLTQSKIESPDTVVLFVHLLALQDTGYFFCKKSLALQESDLIMSAIRKSIVGSIQQVVSTLYITNTLSLPIAKRLPLNNVPPEMNSREGNHFSSCYTGQRAVWYNLCRYVFNLCLTQTIAHQLLNKCFKPLHGGPAYWPTRKFEQ